MLDIPDCGVLSAVVIDGGSQLCWQEGAGVIASLRLEGGLMSVGRAMGGLGLPSVLGPVDPIPRTWLLEPDPES